MATPYDVQISNPTMTNLPPNSIFDIPSRGYKRHNRRTRPDPPETALSIKRQRLIEEDSEAISGTLVCCKTMKCTAIVNKNVAEEYRKRYLQMNRFYRKQQVRTMLQSDSTFKFNGQKVCQKFLMTVFHMSNSLVQAVKRTPRARASASLSMAPRKGTVATRKIHVLVFLRRLAESIGDVMPHKNNEVHLPQHSKKEVYALFRSQYRDVFNTAITSAIPSSSYFCAVWKKYSFHIKVRKNHWFTKCSDCEAFRVQLEHAGADASKSAKIQNGKRNHIRFVTRERLEYATKAERAIRNPNKYCSIVVDGADKSAYGLPHFVHSTKNDRGHKMKVRLVGLKEHAAIPNIMLFLLTEEHQTGANHVIESVHRFLTDKSRSGPLSPVLDVQADNTWRENKNSFFLSYVESLVSLGVFVEANVSFLPIGHTHCDIDQVFSRTSTHLRANAAITLEDLAAEVRCSYKPAPRVSRMSEVANISQLLIKEDCLRKVSRFTQYRFFHFTRSGGEPRCELEQFATACAVRVNAEDKFVPFHKDGGFLKITPDFRKTPPTKIVSPDNEAEVIKFLQTSEERIPKAQQLRALYTLKNEVYKTRDEPFHWNKRDAVELNGRFPLAVASSLNDSSADGECSSTDDDDVLLDYEYEYDFGDFVATRPESATDVFWIGLVREALRNTHGIVIRLKIRWYEPSSSKTSDPFETSYKPSCTTVGTGRRRKKVPWEQEVAVGCVMVRFQHLTSRNKIPSYVGKKIRECLTSKTRICNFSCTVFKLI